VNTDRPALQALIVGNGEPPSGALLEELMVARPLLLCADGWANAVAAYGLVPDFIVGDLDSVRPACLDAVPAERRIRVEADNTGTDLDKVLRQALQLGVKAAALTGVTGRRTDHTLWNLSLLCRYAEELPLWMVDDYCEIRPVRRRLRFRAALGQKVSLCPLHGAAVGVRTQGLRFSLHREPLTPGVRDGISNEVVSNPVEISVESGDLLLVVQRQELRVPVEWEVSPA
jgi:thiamine pyrophosphokinase